jgi:hypothetical protein
VARVSVVGVAVRDQDQVDLAESGEILVLRRRARVLLQERVDDDHLAGRAGEAKRRVPEP